MNRICPKPIPWNDIFQLLARHAKAIPCMPESPPKPLILAGWAYSDDSEKALRWAETVAWANANGCGGIIDQVRDEDYHFS